jgi:hypothetical protein
MRTTLCVAFSILFLAVSAHAADAAATLDKAIEALGGKDKLSAAKAMTWSRKGKITINGTDSNFTSRSTFQSHDRRRAEFNIDLGGNTVEVVIVINGDKGWRQVNGMTEELSGEELDRERRAAYLEWTAATVLPLKQAPFKTESAGEETVNGKPADGVKVTGPVGKPYTVFFDRETHLPAKVVSVATDFAGEATHETTFADYKESDGIKRATKIKVKRNGEDFVDAELTEFKVLDAPDAKAFEKPE